MEKVKEEFPPLGQAVQKPSKKQNLEENKTSKSDTTETTKTPIPINVPIVVQFNSDDREEQDLQEALTAIQNLEEAEKDKIQEVQDKLWNLMNPIVLAPEAA